MNDVTAPIVIPMRFAGVDLLVQAIEVRTDGSEETSAVNRLMDAYEKAESVIVGVAKSVADTIGKLTSQARQPSEVQVQFGLSVSTEGKIVVVSGALEANLSITLTYGG
jgi:hypothetical protein